MSCCSFMQVEKKSPALFTHETGVWDEIWSTETRWLRRPGGPAVHSSIHTGDRCVPLSVIEDTSGLKRHIIH